MRARSLFVRAVLAALLLLPAGRHAAAAPQAVALFPPDLLGEESDPALAVRMGKELQEKLKDRFDVTLVETDSGAGEADRLERRRKARAMGATYTLAGTLTRIGRSVALDLTLAPTEDSGVGRTMFAQATDTRPAQEGGEAPAGTDNVAAVTGVDAAAAKELPFVYRRLAIEASARLKLLFFGDGRVGEGAGRRTIPALKGSVSRSRNIPGEVMSVARGDTDRDGKVEIVAAYRNAIAVYRQEGGDLFEKARIPDAGEGLFHVDAGDVNRNGIAEIVAVRYVAGQALSDVWEFDGTQYRKIADGIPWFLRTADLGREGIVLLGQESDAAEVFTGPVFRVPAGPAARGEAKEMGAALPLPQSTWIYSFLPLKHGETTRLLTIGSAGRPVLLDAAGGKLWEGIDTVYGTETEVAALVATALDNQGRALVRRLYLPGRLLGTDLDGDGNDEAVLLNNLVSAGGFFENLRVYSNSELLCFAQVGDRMELAWRTPQLGASGLDAFLDPSPGGKSFRVGIAARDPGKILGELGEWRLFWVE